MSSLFGNAFMEAEAPTGNKSRTYPYSDGTYKVELLSSGSKVGTYGHSEGHPILYGSFKIVEVIERGECDPMPVGAVLNWTKVIKCRAVVVQHADGTRTTDYEPLESAAKVFGHVKSFVCAFTGFAAEEIDAATATTFFGWEVESFDPQEFLGAQARLKVLRNITKDKDTGQVKEYFNDYYDAISADE